MSDLEVIDAPDRQRFEARQRAEIVGWLSYTPAGRRIVLSHTEVAAAHEGEGIGSTLVRAVLDGIGAQAESQEIVPVCPFVAQFLLRHREYAPLVTPAVRGQFEAR